jgi:hypothetical protein
MFLPLFGSSYLLPHFLVKIVRLIFDLFLGSHCPLDILTVTFIQSKNQDAQQVEGFVLVLGIEKYTSWGAECNLFSLD